MTDQRITAGCLDCIHCDIDMGEPHYSELTPGVAASWDCDKEVWDISYDDDRRTVKQKLATAYTCEHFEWDPGEGEGPSR